MTDLNIREAVKRFGLWGEVAKSALTVMSFLIALTSGVFWLAEEKIWAYLQRNLTVVTVEDVAKMVDERVSSSTGGPCALIPPVGHIASAGPPGRWGSVTWRGVQRLRDDCGRPHVTGIISNGGGFLHDAPLSIVGVPLPVGTFDLSYRFFTNAEVEPGTGTFQVIVTYPDAAGGAPPAISPRLSIAIPDQPRTPRSPI